MVAQEEFWTTSQEVTTDSGSQIIQLQGAASQSLCAWLLILALNPKP